MKCPCCDQEIEPRDEPIMDLGSNVLTFRGQAVKLRGVEAEIVDILAKRSPAAVSRADIVSQVWGLGEREGTVKQIDVHICRIRKMLPAGLRIITHRGRGHALMRTSG